MKGFRFSFASGLFFGVGSLFLKIGIESGDLLLGYGVALL